MIRANDFATVGRERKMEGSCWAHPSRTWHHQWPFAQRHWRTGMEWVDGGMWMVKWGGGVGASLTGAVITEEINSTPSHATSIHSPTPSPFLLSSLFQNTSRETLVACTAGPQKGQPQTCLKTSSTSDQPLWFPSSHPSCLKKKSQ